tara:strand:- start:138 stop:371 length:234 start_codon:yes stop_codon:yes gene_type:complete
MREHSLKGWEEIDKSGPYAGQEVLYFETAFKKWLGKRLDLLKIKKKIGTPSKCKFIPFFSMIRIYINPKISIGIINA